MKFFTAQMTRSKCFEPQKKMKIADAYAYVSFYSIRRSLTRLITREQRVENFFPVIRHQLPKQANQYSKYERIVSVVVAVFSVIIEPRIKEVPISFAVFSFYTQPNAKCARSLNWKRTYNVYPTSMKFPSFWWTEAMVVALAVLC